MPLGPLRGFWQLHGCLLRVLQVRRMSVKRIVQPVIFDNLRNAVPGGLYDSAMGPVDTRGRCALRCVHRNCPWMSTYLLSVCVCHLL